VKLDQKSCFFLNFRYCNIAIWNIERHICFTLSSKFFARAQILRRHFRITILLKMPSIRSALSLSLFSPLPLFLSLFFPLPLLSPLSSHSLSLSLFSSPYFSLLSLPVYSALNPLCGHMLHQMERRREEFRFKLLLGCWLRERRREWK
jgi:hypothetical protein